MVHKVLVANRGEIAIRAFRAATEAHIRTVGVYAHEDRYSLHRQKSDENYLIGSVGHPLRAYLDIDELIRVAKESGADALYPGYGFLSENPGLAEACRDAGITFVGPPPEVLELAGNKVAALRAARDAGLPTLRQVEPTSDIDSLIAEGAELDFPIFVKATAGGGGRGLRRVDDPKDLPEAVASAVSEAELAFGDGTVFLEEAVVSPRHIEVQILADASGSVIHLFERDCSIQRRHQKVIEIAPAPTLDPELRERICQDAVTFAKAIGYRNAGTVEFLVDDAGRHVFIEMNPRIQVEHTVTEEVTGVDLVGAQLGIAAGATFFDLGLSQESISVRGFALQCRITTEDPSQEFRPDTGRITAYRAPGGAGVRLDEGTYVGAEVLPYFDSMLVKVTCRGRDFREACDRALRAITEFRIRGVVTNIGFLQSVLAHPDFQRGGTTTSFISDHEELLHRVTNADRGSRLLSYLADISVNTPFGVLNTDIDPLSKLPQIDTTQPPPMGSKQRLAQLGPKKFAQELRDSPFLGITDTTMRDAHQSLLATRLRTKDLVNVAPAIAHLTPQLWSIEAWGGATYDVALRFLKEDPWQRLSELSDAVPNIALQMLLRGQSTVAYSPQPKEVARAFVREAKDAGVDIFRVFDALNNVDTMRPEIDAVLEYGGVLEGTLCYTGDMASPKETQYTLSYYLAIAEKLVEYGAHVLCIKDMAGLCKAPSARELVSALRSAFDLPVHFHTHDTAGGQLASYLAAIEAGVDAIDGATAPLSGMTSQPSLAAIVAATETTVCHSGLMMDNVLALEPYFEAVRHLYAPFEAGLSSPTGRVYLHEIPGGQLSNLRQQAIALGLGEHFEAIELMYRAVNAIFGNIVKVTPSSKVVGDLALHLVALGVSPEEFEAHPERYDLPESVLAFLSGELGEPSFGWPEPFRTKALSGRDYKYKGVPVLSEEVREALNGPNAKAVLSEVLFPGPNKDYLEATERFGDLSVLPTRAFFYGLRPGEETTVSLSKGVDLFLSLDAIGAPDARGYRDVYCRLNGQSRVLSVRDNAITSEVRENERARSDQIGDVAAPFSGVVTISVHQGDRVTLGQTVATIEAMKMEAAITAPLDGVITRVALSAPTRVEAGDLLVLIEH